jgi:hypothetical protein
MGHQPDRLERLVALRLGQERERLLARLGAEAAHAAVELHVDPGGPAGRGRASRGQGEELPRPGDDIGAGLERDRELVRRQCAHHEDPSRYTAVAQRRRLIRGRNREPGGAAGERRVRARQCAVPVAVRLDDRAERRVHEARPEEPAVSLDRTQVHSRERPLDRQHGRRRLRAAAAHSPARVRASSASTRVPTVGSAIGAEPTRALQTSGARGEAPRSRRRR